MAMPFEPLNTEKLKNYFKKVVDANCRAEDTNSCFKKHSGRKTRNKLGRTARILETWGQRVINS